MSFISWCSFPLGPCGNATSHGELPHSAEGGTSGLAGRQAGHPSDGDRRDEGSGLVIPAYGAEHRPADQR